MLKTQHVSWCCKCYHKPPKPRSPLEIEALKKQLAQSYAMLHFMVKKRAVHHTPQTENELTITQATVDRLRKLLGLDNKETSSVPQEKASQTEPPAETETKTPDVPETESEEEEEEEEDGDISTESPLAEKQSFVFLFLLNHTAQSADDAQTKVLRMSEDELNKAVDHAKSVWGQKYKKQAKEAHIHTLDELVEISRKKKR